MDDQSISVEGELGVGVRVQWDVRSGDRVIGTKQGQVVAREGQHLAIKVDLPKGDPSSPFVSRLVSSVRVLQPVACAA
jgi:hypothetical protein